MVARWRRAGLASANAALNACWVVVVYGLLGPPLGALLVAGPLLAVFGYAGIGPAMFVGGIHGGLLIFVRTPWLRMLAVLFAGIAATAYFLGRDSTTHASGWIAEWLNQNFELIARVALLPSIVCMGVVESIHQSRKRVQSVRLEPLRVAHLDDLADALLQRAVYEHIGGTVPSRADFRHHLERSLAGPPPECADEVWLNWLIRDEAGFRVLGCMEAVAHDGLVEVAFLMRPDFWGQGLARDALARMHAELEARFDPLEAWAATTLANRRSQALLERSGYVRVTGPLPKLFSHDEGDLVYVRRNPGR